MFVFYANKLLFQIPFVILIVGAVPRLRANRHWANWLQVVGPCITVLYMVYDWVFYDPFLGIRRHTVEVLSAESAAEYVSTPFWYLLLFMPGLGLALFSVGYLFGDKARDADNTEHLS